MNSHSTKIYLIAGEASGDMHAANLVSELKNLGNYSFRGMGGKRMQEAGVDLIQDYKELNLMGLVEVIKKLNIVLKRMKSIEEDIVKYKPNTIILIDFPAFNLRIAKFCKKLGIKVVYYISPQIWAWKQGRVKKIKKYVDEMICILPFEKEFYQKFGMHVHYVGHPLIDALKTYQYNEEFISNLKSKANGKKIIALLPGSRKAEINSKLPIMLELAEKYKDEYYFIIAGAPGADKSLYNNLKNIDIAYHHTYDILKSSYAAVVTSGTATLEAALHHVPEVIGYKMNELNYQIGKRVVKVKYICLVNLILDEPVITELIQHDLTIEKLTEEFEQITSTKRDFILTKYQELVTKLGSEGASGRAATIIHNSIAYENIL